jgi:hypothetical protein
MVKLRGSNWDNFSGEPIGYASGYQLFPLRLSASTVAYHSVSAILYNPCPRQDVGDVLGQIL